MAKVAGFVVSGDTVKVVVAEVPTNLDAPISIEFDETWSLQSGAREPALHVLHQRCASFLKEKQIKATIVKASAVSRAPASLALLHSAELRGVITAAAASQAQVKSLAKGVMSRNYGKRKVDEYVEDESFWQEKTEGALLRKGSREAALLILASRES